MTLLIRLAKEHVRCSPRLRPLWGVFGKAGCLLCGAESAVCVHRHNYSFLVIVSYCPQQDFFSFAGASLPNHLCIIPYHQAFSACFLASHLHGRPSIQEIRSGVILKMPRMYAIQLPGPLHSQTVPSSRLHGSSSTKAGLPSARNCRNKSARSFCSSSVGFNSTPCSQSILHFRQQNLSSFRAL